MSAADWDELIQLASGAAAPPPPPPPAAAPSADGDRAAELAAFRSLADGHGAVHDVIGKLGLSDAREIDDGLAARAAAPLVRVRNFLPAKAAAGARAALEALPPSAWEGADAAADVASDDGGAKGGGAGSAMHSYRVGDGAGSADVAKLLRLVAGCFPAKARRRLGGLRARLQCARYARGDFIEPHDDAAFATIGAGGGGGDGAGAGVLASRDVALVYYLTRGWRADLGGCLVDLEGPGELIVPEFNTLVAFRVPRLHEVTRMATDRPRLTVFGWMLRPGRLYDLAPPPRSADAASSGARKRRKRKRAVTAGI